MRCFMRFSDESNGGQPKPRPEGFSKRKCFENFLEVFGPDDVDVVADCVKPDTHEWLASAGVTVHPTSSETAPPPSSTRSICASRRPSRRRGRLPARGRLSAPATLAADPRGGPRVRRLRDALPTIPTRPWKDPARILYRGRSEVTRLYRSASVHWKITNSTPLTFATRVHRLRADYAVYARFNGDGESRSFLMSPTCGSVASSARREVS